MKGKRLPLTLMSALLCLLTAAGCQSSTNNSSPSDSHSGVSQTSVSENSNQNSQNKQDESSDQSSVRESSPDDYLEDSTAYRIVDRNGKQIGQIPQSGMITMTDYGLFYSTSEEQPEGISVGTDSDSDTQFHLYDPVKNESYDFGTIEDMDYEAGYVRTELDGILYTLITTGDALDTIPDPLILLAFDLKAHTVRQHVISENGFPYTAMTEAEGKLLILNHNQQDILHDEVIEFDPADNSCRKVLEFRLSGDEKGETLRQLDYDGKYLYLLRLKFEDSDHVTMFWDTYDPDFQKHSEKDITSLMKNAVLQNGLVEEDFTNETKQMVSRFHVTDGAYLYYENFSTTHFFANGNTGDLFPEVNSLCYSSSGSGTPLYYDMFGGNPITVSSDNNALYEWKNGSLVKSFFNDADSRYYLTGVSVSRSGIRIIRMEYTNPEDNNDTLPTKIYYLPDSSQT